MRTRARCGIVAALGVTFAAGVTALDGADPGKEFEAEVTRAGARATAHGGTGGTATFHRNGHGVAYELDLRRLEGVSAVHVHSGTGARDGPVRVYLYGSSRPARFYDRLYGTFYAYDVHDLSIDALLEAMATGRAYVDVHLAGERSGSVRGQVVQARSR